MAGSGRSNRLSDSGIQSGPLERERPRPPASSPSAGSRRFFSFSFFRRGWLRREGRAEPQAGRVTAPGGNSAASERGASQAKRLASLQSSGHVRTVADWRHSAPADKLAMLLTSSK